MTNPVRVLETVSLVAPLGVRFWDTALQRPAEDGLTVTLNPESQPGRKQGATSGKSGVYSFHKAPGLARMEYGSGDAPWWSANTGVLPFVLEVTDPLGRYLPYQVRLRLPNRGLFGLNTSPPQISLTPDSTWLPMFSAPARNLDTTLAVARGSVEDTITGRPASFALMEVRVDSITAYGMADGRGVVSVFFPFPEPRNMGLGSPFGGRTPLTEQNWTVSVRLLFGYPASVQEVPDLTSVLSQPTAAVWRDNSLSSPFSQATLQFQQELVLRSLDAPSGRPLPVLLITAAVSPPIAP